MGVKQRTSWSLHINGSPAAKGRGRSHDRQKRQVCFAAESGTVLARSI